MKISKEILKKSLNNLLGQAESYKKELAELEASTQVKSKQIREVLEQATDIQETLKTLEENTNETKGKKSKRQS